ncbi:Hpt domain-containing protein [Sulfurimonas sp. HSL-1656]|uniref:Hpt domain-containing protein n=1 Tax=Thiomicrolovo subterrani TaxID=3131934 RepID=UPI0031F7F230
MPYLSILVIFIVVVLLAGLISVVLTRMRNRRHLASMHDEVELAKYTEKKPATKPKIMKGAQPDVGIRILRAEHTGTGEHEAGSSTPGRKAEEKVPAFKVVSEHPAAPFVPRHYPPFSNARAVAEFGLSQEEADSFTGELIAQIESEIADLEAAVTARDSVQLEEVLHKLKGSTSNLGEGGITTLLADFNNYIKEGTDQDTIDDYVANLHYYLEELKKAFPS